MKTAEQRKIEKLERFRIETTFEYAAKWARDK